MDETMMQWKAASTAAAVVAGIGARKVLEPAWRSVRPQAGEPPLNPADRSVDWKDALAWAALSGVVVGVARLVAQRAAAAGWEAATGGSPPGLTTA